MRPLILTAIPEDRNEKISPPSLVAYDFAKYFCSKWADGTVTFDVTRDYETEDMKQIIQIQDQFFTIFNSLIEKDSEIEFLKEKNKALAAELTLSISPVIERQ